MIPLWGTQEVSADLWSSDILISEESWGYSRNVSLKYVYLSEAFKTPVITKKGVWGTEEP